MGKKDKKKKKDPEKKAQLQQRKELKTEKIAKKKAQKSAKADADSDEEDIEKMIEKFKKMDAEKVAVTEEVVSNPTPRVHATLTVNPLKEGELILFGGEFFNGEYTYLYNDLFKYNIEKKEWRKYSSPNSPPPRCSHQVAVYKNWMYLFGGEFTSPSQNQFYHYKDMWRLNLENMSWEQLKDVKNTPSARSGHRMCVWKHKLILFGGFYDTLSEIRYYNDLHLMDLDSHSWKKVDYKFTESVPRPRSGFCMGVFENMLYVYGGYSKEKTSKYGELEGVTHTDLWGMNLSNPNLTWEKLKKSGVAPSPRSGISMVVDKKRMVLFGGVVDEEKEDTLNSAFFNDMYAFHMDTKRWFVMTLHLKKKKGKEEKQARKERKKQQQQQQTAKVEASEHKNQSDDEESAKYDYEEDETNQNQEQENQETPAPEIKESKKEETPVQETPPKEPTSPSVSNANSNEEKSILPSPRINANMAIVNNVLYLYGGVYEQGDREIAMNDLWALNLHKMDTFQNILTGDVPEWVGEVSGDEDDDEEEDESDEENEEEEKGKEEEVKEDEENENENEEEEVEEKAETKQEAKPQKKSGSKKGKLEELRRQLQAFQKDGIPIPNTRETMRDFFARTADFWQKYALEKVIEQDSTSTEKFKKEDEKALKRDGFKFAEDRFKEMRPVLQELEDIEDESKQAEKEKEKKKKAKQQSTRNK